MTAGGPAIASARVLQHAPAGADGQAEGKGRSMNLGERCDEIVRLIDETLADLEIDRDDAPVATVTALGPGRDHPDTGRRRTPHAGPPGRTAAGF